MRAGDRIDRPSIERKEEQVLEARRKIPTEQRFVVDAIAGDDRVVTKTPSHKGQGRDVFVLDAVAVVPEVRGRLEHGRVELALSGGDV